MLTDEEICLIEISKSTDINDHILLRGILQGREVSYVLIGLILYYCSYQSNGSNYDEIFIYLIQHDEVHKLNLNNDIRVALKEKYNNDDTDNLPYQTAYDYITTLNPTYLNKIQL